MLMQEEVDEVFKTTGRRVVRSTSSDGQRGVYGISVAAELVGMGTQTLRLYESRGLLEPERTDGGTRRYSADDLDRLRRIGDLLGAGLNLAGIGMVLDLEAANTHLEAANTKLQAANTELRAENATTRRSTRRPTRE